MFLFVVDNALSYTQACYLNLKKQIYQLKIYQIYVKAKWEFLQEMEWLCNVVFVL